MLERYSRGLLAILLLGSAACETNSVTDVLPPPTTTRDQIADSLFLHSGSDSTDILLSLRSPTGSILRFIELKDGARAGVLVLEEGDPGTLALDRIVDAAGGTLNAADLYTSLVEPDRADAAIPARLRALVQPSTSARPAGWAREFLATTPPVTLAANQVACDNSNFTSSIGGGFLANVFKRLDTGPSHHPALWVPYDFDGFTHYWYQTWAYDTPRWRGKVCGRPGFHPQVDHGLTTVPALQFLYRAGASWKLAGKIRALGPGTRVFTWMYDGGLGAIDWRIMIYDAYLFDGFDIMMTWQ
jgi:hypothetical protein